MSLSFLPMPTHIHTCRFIVFVCFNHVILMQVIDAALQLNPSVTVNVNKRKPFGSFITILAQKEQPKALLTHVLLWRYSIVCVYVYVRCVLMHMPIIVLMFCVSGYVMFVFKCFSRSPHRRLLYYRVLSVQLCGGSIKHAHMYELL